MSIWGKLKKLFRKKPQQPERERLYVPQDDSELSETRVLTPEEVNELEHIMNDESDGWTRV